MKIQDCSLSHSFNLLHPPTPKIHQDPQTPLWSRGNEIHHSDFEGEINGHGEKEGLPTEYQYEFEQEMLKHVHDLKNEIREKGWREGESPEVSQTSFLRNDESDAQLGFKLLYHSN